jgi:hypothetical protein
MNGKNRTMDALYNLSPGFARWTDAKAEMPAQSIDRLTIQKISTGLSLMSLALGFSIFGILIIVNRHQADLHGLSGESSLAIAGGIGAILVGTVFLVAACCHWRFYARRSVTLSVRRQATRLTFSRPQPAMAIALLD